MKIAFVTTFCPHYRVRTFETLSNYYNTDFIFYSDGKEWYWQPKHGIYVGKFNLQYLHGVNIGKTRIAPDLPKKLFFGNYDVFIKCINGRFALPITFLISKLNRKPFILWTGIWMRLQTRAHKILFPLTRWIYTHSDAVVVYGEHVKRYLISEGVPAERIFVAYHAIDNDEYNTPIKNSEKIELRKQLGLSNKKVILYIGRLEESKGVEYLIEAFSKISDNDSVLVIAGTGSKEKIIRELVEEKGLSTFVAFAGYVPPEQTKMYYAVADVSVLPSITMPYGKEPWGLTINEAFNQGVPVVVTETVGAAAGGLVINNKNGLIVPERDADALAIAVTKILTDERLKDQFSKNALSVITDWNNKKMVNGFVQAIEYVTVQNKAKNKKRFSRY